MNYLKELPDEARISYGKVVDYMNYRYKCGNEVIRVWVWNDDFHTEVSVTDSKSNKSYGRTIREDENGKFFTWNKNN